MTGGPRGLFGKYVAYFVGLVILVLALNGAFETWFTYRDLTIATDRTQSEKAEVAAQRIDQFLAELERQISWATRASVTTIAQRRADYATLLEQVPSVEELTQLDGQGREQLRLSRASVAIGTGADFSRDDRFTAAVAQRTWFGPAYIRGNERYMTIAMAHSGRDAGVTVAEINLRFLRDILNGVQMSKGGTAYVVDRQGRLLAHSDATLFARHVDVANLPQVEAIRNQNAERVTMGLDPDGRRVLTSSAPCQRMRWFVFVEQPITQALAPLYELLARIGSLLALGLLVAVLCGVLVARRMVVPIRALQAGSRRLESGDFSHRIDVKTGDEIEELAVQFNRMAGELQESYTRLEHKVEERTRDLAQSVRELKALEEIGRAVASSLDVKAVLATIVSRAVELAKADAGAIFSYDSEQRAFQLAEAHGVDAAFLDAVRAMRIDGTVSMLGRAARGREPIPVSDLSALGDDPLAALTLAAGFNAELVVPLVGTNDILGALIVQRKAAGEFSPSTVELMQTFAHQSVLAMSNAQLFRQVEEKGRELAVANAHKSRFFANMSHELRTPLNAVLGYSELLADGLYGKMPDKSLEVLQRIQTNGKHLLGLINDVLDISKLEAGQLALAPEDYSMRDLVNAAVASTESLAQTKGLAVKVNVGENLPAGWGDYRRLTQVLLNILGNAIKFTDTGAVEIRADVHEGRFHIAISDTGLGIAPADQARIFEEFQQVDSSSTRQKGGTGLGLSIARQFVAMHGGSIRLESTLGVGSTFHIVVPVRVKEPRSPAQPAQPSTGATV